MTQKMEIDSKYWDMSTNIRLEPSRIYCTYSVMNHELYYYGNKEKLKCMRQAHQVKSMIPTLRQSQSGPRQVTYEAVAWLIRVGRA